MPLTIVDICEVKYPGQIEAGNIAFYKPDEDILIKTWNVPNVPQPLESDLLAEESQWEKVFAQHEANMLFSSAISQVLDSTAKQKQYYNAASIVGYISSSNIQWKNEAAAFIAWRDTVFAYAFNLQSQIEAGNREMPALEDFIKALPIINWPA